MLWHTTCGMRVGFNSLLHNIRLDRNIRDGSSTERNNERNKTVPKCKGDVTLYFSQFTSQKLSCTRKIMHYY
jgi:hypothetical protein